MSVKQQLQEEFDRTKEKETVIVPYGSTMVKKIGYVAPRVLTIKDPEFDTLPKHVSIAEVDYTLWDYDGEREKLVYLLDT